MKVMIRRTPQGLSAYVPKKDLEEAIVELQKEEIWGGWVRLKNGMVLDLPAMTDTPTLPITVNAKVRRSEA